MSTQPIPRRRPPPPLPSSHVPIVDVDRAAFQEMGLEVASSWQTHVDDRGVPRRVVYTVTRNLP